MESAKDGKASKDKSKSSSYDSNAAVKYLDTHDVWNESEMSKYDDLKNLNQQIIKSLLIGKWMISRNLYKSKGLKRIEHLMREYDHLSRKQKDRFYIKFQSSTSSINYPGLIMDLIERTDTVRNNKKMNEYNEKVTDSIKVC